MAREPKPLLAREIQERGGRNSRKNLTPERRKQLAQKAANARWAKAKGQAA